MPMKPWTVLGVVAVILLLVAWCVHRPPASTPRVSVDSDALSPTQDLRVRSAVATSTWSVPDDPRLFAPAAIAAEGVRTQETPGSDDQVTPPPPPSLPSDPELQQIDPAPSDEEMPEAMSEDQAMAFDDNIPEQREWRGAWTRQREDEGWTETMRQEIADKAKSLVEGPVKVDELSCRETVCRMYLKFADQLDAKAFISSDHDPNLHYEYQSLDPKFDGVGFDRSDHTYEVLVTRPRPEGLAEAPVEVPSSVTVEAPTTSPEEGSSLELPSPEAAANTVDTSDGIEFSLTNSSGQ